MHPDVKLRRLAATDSIEELTELLHRAYAPLAARGMRFVASWQDADETRRRCEDGEAWVAELNGRVVGTVTLYPPARTSGSPFLDRADVASFGQFAVEPALQGGGIGEAMRLLVERRAREEGAAHLALDTSEHARELIATYERWGFRFIEHVQWSSTNYRSVVMARALS